MANANQPDGRYVFQKPVRAAFLNALEPTAVQVNGKPKGEPNFNATLLIPPDSPDLAALKEKMAFIARAKWPTKPFVDAATGLPAIHFGLKAGEKKAEEARVKSEAAGFKGRDVSFYLGHVVLGVHSKNRPNLSVLQNGKLVVLDTDVLRAQYKSKFYHGCFIAPAISLVAWDGNGSNIPDSVTAYLQSVLWIKDGPRIGGADQAEVFKDYIGQHTPGVDPTDGLNDEIPF